MIAGQHIFNNINLKLKSAFLLTQTKAIEKAITAIIQIKCQNLIQIIGK